MKREAKNIKFLQIALIVLVLLAGAIYFFSSYEVQFSPSVSVKKTSQSQGVFTPLPSTQKLCGNGKIDPNEDCNSCPQDAQCAFGDSCQEKWDGSIELLSITPETSATIKVTNAKGKSETKTVQLYETAIINGLEIYIYSIYSKEGVAFRVFRQGEYEKRIYLEINQILPYPVSEHHACDLDCTVPRVINNGDPYFKEDKTSPNWRWIIANLDEQIPTSVSRDFTIHGPAIGLGNSFQTQNVDTALSNENSAWTASEIMELKFSGLWPIKTNEEDDKGTAIISVKQQSYDTSNAIGVPQEYQSLLSSSASVIRLTASTPQLTPSTAVPIFIPSFENSGQINHVGRGDPINTVSYTILNSEGGEERIDAYLEEVLEDKSIQIGLTNRSCLNTTWQSCTYSKLPSVNIPRAHDFKIFDYYIENYESQFYPPIWQDPNDPTYVIENHKKWALIYARQYSQNHTRVYPSNEIILQTVELPNPLPWGSKNVTLAFYRDFFNPEMLRFYDVFSVENSWNSNFARVDFYNNGLSYSLLKNENSIEIEARSYGWLQTCDNLVQSFTLTNNNILSSYGDHNFQSEEGELFCKEDGSTLKLGDKDYDFYLNEDLDVKNPVEHSSNSNEAQYELYWMTRYFDTSISTCSGEFWQGIADCGSKNLQNYYEKEIFSSDEWLFTNKTISQWLNLQAPTFIFNGQQTALSEAIAGGINTPRYVGNIFPGGFDLSSYDPKQVYLATKPAINSQGNLQSEGFIYLNIFETPVNLQTLSSQNPLNLFFRGQAHELLGYVDEDSVLIKPYCKPECGNSVIEAYEQCDKENLNGQTCASLGLGGGTLKCSNSIHFNSCKFDTSECTCGNGIVDDGEQCDWFNIDATCESLGFSGGTMMCNYCQYDTTHCSKCGNGIVEQGEQCDDQNLNNLDSCTNQCELPVCGDGVCSSFGTENCNSCPVDCGTCCFLPGTKVTTPSGVKSIENLKVGDQILSFNEKTKTNEPAKVEKTFEHQTSGYLIVNNKLFVTQEHPFLINGEWKTIGQAKLGDKMQTIDGKTEIISSIQKVAKQVTVYNIEVSPNNNYYAEGILAHNKPPIDIFPDPDIDNSDDDIGQQTE